MERLPTFAELIHAGVPPAEAKRIIEQRSITIVDIPKKGRPIYAGEAPEIPLEIRRMIQSGEMRRKYGLETDSGSRYHWLRSVEGGGLSDLEAQYQVYKEKGYVAKELEKGTYSQDIEAAERSLTEEIAAARAYEGRLGTVKDPELLGIIKHNLNDEVNDHAYHLKVWIKKHKGK